MGSETISWILTGIFGFTTALQWHWRHRTKLKISVECQAVGHLRTLIVRVTNFGTELDKLQVIVHPKRASSNQNILILNSFGHDEDFRQPLKYACSREYHAFNYDPAIPLEDYADITGGDIVVTSGGREVKRLGFKQWGCQLYEFSHPNPSLPRAPAAEQVVYG